MSLKRTSGLKRKKMGRPVTTGKSPMLGIRFPREKIAQIRAWADKNDAKSLSDAVRQMVDIVLKSNAER
jgi:hypothetical protein